MTMDWAEEAIADPEYWQIPFADRRELTRKYLEETQSDAEFKTLAADVQMKVRQGIVNDMLVGPETPTAPTVMPKTDQFEVPYQSQIASGLGKAAYGFGKLGQGMTDVVTQRLDPRIRNFLFGELPPPVSETMGPWTQELAGMSEAAKAPMAPIESELANAIEGGTEMTAKLPAYMLGGAAAGPVLGAGKAAPWLWRLLRGAATGGTTLGGVEAALNPEAPLESFAAGARPGMAFGAMGDVLGPLLSAIRSPLIRYPAQATQGAGSFTAVNALENALAGQPLGANALSSALQGGILGLSQTPPSRAKLIEQLMNREIPIPSPVRSVSLAPDINARLRALGVEPLPEKLLESRGLPVERRFEPMPEPPPDWEPPMIETAEGMIGPTRPLGLEPPPPPPYLDYLETTEGRLPYYLAPPPKPAIQAPGIAQRARTGKVSPPTPKTPPEAQEGPPGVVPEQRTTAQPPDLTTQVPEGPTFRQFIESKGHTWPMKLSDPDYPALKTEFDRGVQQPAQPPPDPVQNVSRETSAAKEPWQMTQAIYRHKQFSKYGNRPKMDEVGDMFEKQVERLGDKVIQKVGSDNPQAIVAHYNKKYGFNVNMDYRQIPSTFAGGNAWMAKGMRDGEPYIFIDPVRAQKKSKQQVAGMIRHELEHYIDAANKYVGNETLNWGNMDIALGRGGPLQPLPEALLMATKGHHQNYLFFETDYLHRISVREALEQGKPILPEVLADYPDLAQEYSKQAESPAPEAKPERPPELTPAQTPPEISPPSDVLPSTKRRQPKTKGQQLPGKGKETGAVINPAQAALEAVDETQKLAIAVGRKTMRGAKNIARDMRQAKDGIHILANAFSRNEKGIQAAKTRYADNVVDFLSDQLAEGNFFAGKQYKRAEQAAPFAQGTVIRNWFMENPQRWFEAYEKAGPEGGPAAVAKLAEKDLGPKDAAKIKQWLEVFKANDEERGDLAVALNVKLHDPDGPKGGPRMDRILDLLSEKSGKKIEQEDIVTPEGNLSFKQIRDLLDLKIEELRNREDLARYLGVAATEITQKAHYRDFKKIPNHIPHVFSEEVRRAIDKGRGDKVYDAFWKALQITGLNPDTTINEYRRKYASRQYGPIENVRLLEDVPYTFKTEDGREIPTWEMNPFVLMYGQIEPAAQRLAHIKYFGQFGATARADQIAHGLYLTSGKGKGGQAVKAFRNIWEQMNERGSGNLNTILESLRFAENIGRVGQLSAATVSQISGLGPSATIAGVSNTGKSLMKFMGASIARRLNMTNKTQAEVDMLYGAGAFLRDTLGHTVGVEDLTGISSGLSKYFKVIQFERANRVLNIVGAHAAITDFSGMIAALREPPVKFQGLKRVWGMDQKSMRSWIKRIYNYSDESIDRMVNNGVEYQDFADVANKAMTDPKFYRAFLDLARVAQTATAKENLFRETPLTRPAVLSSHAARLFFAYTSYLRAQGNLLADSLNAAKTGNFRPIVTKLGMDAAGGALVSLIKDWMFDREHKDVPPFVRLLDWWTEAATFGMMGGITEDVYWYTKTGQRSLISIAPYEWMLNAFYGGYKGIKTGIEEGPKEGSLAAYKQIGRKTPIIRAIDAQLGGPISQANKPKPQYR